MKLILRVCIQMCLIALVFSDAKRPEHPQKCGDEYDDECPPGYICDYNVYVKVKPSTTTTTKKPTPPKPTQCCWPKNQHSNCYFCFLPFNCYEGKYCYIPPTRPPTTTPEPTRCENDYGCPSGYKCDNKICVPIPTTTTLKPTLPKPTQCCWIGNRGTSCYGCGTLVKCYKGQYCQYVPTPTTPSTPTTTTPPATPQPCDQDGDCPEGSKCDCDVCIPKYCKKLLNESDT